MLGLITVGNTALDPSGENADKIKHVKMAYGEAGRQSQPNLKAAHTASVRLGLQG